MEGSVIIWESERHKEMFRQRSVNDAFDRKTREKNSRSMSTSCETRIADLKSLARHLNVRL